MTQRWPYLGALAITALLCAGPASAADWVPLTTGSGLALSYLPPIIHAGPGMVRIWVRLENATPQTSGGVTYMSSVTLEELNCTDMKSRSLQDLLYPRRGLGGSPAKIMTVTNWVYVLPNSIGANVAKFACGSA
jgi:hypothetical protein